MEISDIKQVLDRVVLESGLFVNYDARGQCRLNLLAHDHPIQLFPVHQHHLLKGLFDPHPPQQLLAHIVVHLDLDTLSAI